MKVINPNENEENPGSYQGFKNWKTKSFKAISIAFVFIFISMMGASTDESVIQTIEIESETEPLIERTEKQLYVESVRIRVEEELVKEVSRYMYKVAPESKISAKFLVSKCQEYEMDIIFVLAQGILESHLGTKGVAKTTNSVWNVGTYDDGQILYTYKTPDESIDPYLSLLRDKYLMKITSKGDTVQTGLHTLLADRGYKNMYGNRFATAKGYENALRKLIVKIDLGTTISMYQSVSNLHEDFILAYFRPIDQPIIELALLQ